MPDNQCEGCNRRLPIHAGVHVAEELEMLPCTASRYNLELEPITRDTWVDDKARKKVKAPFTFGGGR